MCTHQAYNLRLTNIKACANGIEWSAIFPCHFYDPGKFTFAELRQAFSHENSLAVGR